MLHYVNSGSELCAGMLDTKQIVKSSILALTSYYYEWEHQYAKNIYRTFRYVIIFHSSTKIYRTILKFYLINNKHYGHFISVGHYINGKHFSR